MRIDQDRFRNLIRIVILFAYLLLSCPVLYAADDGVGVFSRIDGAVDLMRGGALPAVPVKAGDPVRSGDFIRTKSNARAEVTFKDGNILKIAQRSRLDVSEYLAAGSGDRRKFNLPRGKVQAVVTKGGTGENKGSRFEIHTPNAVAGVRGTDFFVYHDRNVTGILVKEGSVYAFNPKLPQNIVTVPAGTVTTVTAKGAPLPPRSATDAEKRNVEKETTLKQKGNGKSEKKDEADQGQTESQQTSGMNGSGAGLASEPLPDSAISSTTSTQADTIIPPKVDPPPITETQPDQTLPSQDTVPPVITLVKPPPATSTGTPTTFSVQSSVSGTIRYRLDNAAWQDYPGSIGGLAEGTHLVEFQVVDLAGNASAPVATTLFVGSRAIALKGKMTGPPGSPADLTGRLFEFGDRSAGSWQFSASGTGTPTQFALQAGGVGNLDGTTLDGFWQLRSPSLSVTSGSIAGDFTYTYLGVDRFVSSPGMVSGSYDASGWNFAATGSVTAGYSTPLGFVSDINVGPMSRANSIDANSNLLTIENQGNMSGLLGGETGLWSSPTVPITLMGIYQGPGSRNSYWNGKISSHNYLTGGIGSYDGAAFSGFIGGANLDPIGTTSGNISAIYVAPRGNGEFGAGLIYGNFKGNLGNGFWEGSGSMERQELNSTIATDPATMPADWWQTKTVSVTPPVVTGPVFSHLNNENNSDGFLLDASLNISSRMKNRGDVMNLTVFTPDPTFGVWQRESFGSFSGTGTDLVLVTDAAIAAPTNGKGGPDHIFNVVSYCAWGTNGDISGKAYGAWGDWSVGKARLLSGTMTGSYNQGVGTFGAVTTGAWLDVSRFLSLTQAERQQAGFPGIQTGTFALSGSNTAGSSVTFANIRTFTHAAGDRLSLWATDSVSGTFSGAIPEGEQIAVSDGSHIMGTFRLEHGGISPTTGNNVWLAEINGLGETSGSFRSSFNGVAAGTWSGSTFSGTAAGITHPITYYSSFGSVNLLKRYDGFSGYQYDGALSGVFGGLSLWKANENERSEFDIVGLHTPAALKYNNYIFSTALASFDVPTGSGGTADGGAYKGYLAGALSNGGSYPEEPIDGRIAAIYAAPDGRAGILAGKLSGYLDMNGVWEAHGDWFPIEILSLPGSVPPSTWNVQTAFLPLNMAQSGAFIGTGGSIITPITPGNGFDRTWISTIPVWGVWSLATAGNYSGPTSNNWKYKLSATDGNFSVDGEILGDRWEALPFMPPAASPVAGKLHGIVGGSWVDMSQAVPMTGILIGENIGTFDPNSANWQAMAVGAFMETNTFLQMAATADGQAKLRQLNIPAFEIGSANFTGSGGASGDTVTISRADVKFFAPTAGGRPIIWATGNILGSYTGNPLAVGNVPLSGSSATVNGLSPTLTMDSWTGGKWRASISDTTGTGTVGGHTNINMFGRGAGSYSAGSFSGTASGMTR
ncbi:fecR protein [Geobacter sp. OR-1]|uniref:FecR domain-containing protein n=1 Tax=Geobacter sp. OR-1 TaxID=1266765 RepID=UPI000543226C|nr:FecR domain-containing protein [Geobacter sp. OR-1]GAM09366.1 fecR protein [Geobacter sp. OR-1]